MTIHSIRQVTGSDWALYKKIRLQSLRESPDSFCSTLECESARTDDQWRDRLSATDGSAFALPLISFDEAVVTGIAWGVIHDEKDQHSNVYQMWISPEYRGQGIAKALLRKIIDWSIDKGVESVHLGVNTNNEVAIRLYESIGFRVFGKTVPLRKGSVLRVQDMALDLSRYQLSKK